MTRSLSPLSLSFLTLAAATASTGAFATPTLYRITDLGIPTGHNGSYANAIDDAGRVGGYLDHELPAFIWTAKGGYRLAPLTELHNGPMIQALDGTGGAVGYYLSTTALNRAFHSSASGKLSLLPQLDSTASAYSYAFGVNALGTIIGTANLPSQDVQHAVTWSARGIVDRNPEGYLNSAGIAINDSGQMLLGASGTAGTNVLILQPNGKSVALPLPTTGTAIQATGMNAAATVSGAVLVPPFQQATPAIWRGAQDPLILTAGTPYDGQFGVGRTINDAETVVGELDGPIDSFTFVWTAADGMNRLQDLIDPADPLYGKPFFNGTVARINNKGQIAITATIGTGSKAASHALLLTPEQ